MLRHGLQALVAQAAAHCRSGGALELATRALPQGVPTLLRRLSAAAAAAECDGSMPAWVFLGPPGVGKGTYATRIADWLSIPHVAAGDLVREEMKSGSELGCEMASIVNAGDLLPDDVVVRLLQLRMARARREGDPGVLLDGFPRTVGQAARLMSVADVQLALNLQLDESILVEKCLGRRICSRCGKNYNVADIRVPAAPGRPEIVMPPLSPPPECADALETRADDTEPVVRHRLQVYNSQAAPLEEFFRRQGCLIDFPITGGIPETLPRLQAVLEPFADRLKGGGCAGEHHAAAHAA